MAMENFECEMMNWTLFAELSKNVADRIIESNYAPDFMVGLARGGWVLSRVLCDYLGVKDLISLKVEHWGVTATPDGKARIKYPFKVDLTGRKVLVVDDITDTGESMKVATDYIHTLNPLEVKTAALRHIEGSKFTPDFYGDIISWRWVVFPWNYIEDMCNIIPKVMSQGVTVKEMKEKLNSDYSISISEEEILRIIEEIERRERSKGN
jgi:hypoxanthine phosphoribosyltransferase